MYITIRIIPPLFMWIAFIFVVLNVPYPDNITGAGLNQLGLFFIPLYLAINFTLNMLLKNIYFSSTLSFGLILLLILQALDSLNIVTGILIIISVGLLLSYFQKIKKKNLTKLPKIPKLTSLQKQDKN